MKRNLKREETHNRLLETGLSLFVQQGYHGTGIKEVVDQADLPKGSFYTYFSSKESFGGAVVDHFALKGDERLEAVISQAKTPLEGLRRFFEISRDRLEEQDFAGGCLFGNFSNELGAQADEITPHLVRGMENRSRQFAEILEQGQAEGQVRRDMAAGTLGDLLLNGWEGALMRAKTQRSAVPLDQFLQSYFEVMLRV